MTKTSQKGRGGVLSTRLPDDELACVLAPKPESESKGAWVRRLILAGLEAGGDNEKRADALGAELEEARARIAELEHELAAARGELSEYHQADDAGGQPLAEGLLLDQVARFAAELRLEQTRARILSHVHQTLRRRPKGPGAHMGTVRTAVGPALAEGLPLALAQLRDEGLLVLPRPVPAEVSEADREAQVEVPGPEGEPPALALYVRFP